MSRLELDGFAALVTYAAVNYTTFRLPPPELTSGSSAHRGLSAAQILTASERCNPLLRLTVLRCSRGCRLAVTFQPSSAATTPLQPSAGACSSSASICSRLFSRTDVCCGVLLLRVRNQGSYHGLLRPKKLQKVVAGLVRRGCRHNNRSQACEV